MSDDVPIGLPAAARALGMSLRNLRQAIWSGHVEAPANLSATATLPPGWVTSAAAALAATPRPVGRRRQKVPPFARYEGTSAWRKYPTRVREYAQFLASARDKPTA